MSDLRTLSFLDPEIPLPPATASQRAAVLARGRRRRLLRHSAVSSPFVIVLAVALVIALTIGGTGSSRARIVVPTGPQPLNMTGAAATAPGCPDGQVLGAVTVHGVSFTAVAAPGQDIHHYVCARLANGTAVHQEELGTGLEPFPDGSYLAVDGLGHVFANLAPGNVNGVLVLVPGPNTVKVLGIYIGSVDQSTSPFSLSLYKRLCEPDCARGGQLHFRAVWDPATDQYVYDDPPLAMSLDPLQPDWQLPPETYRAPDGTVIYPTQPTIGTDWGLIRWTITTSAQPFTIRPEDFLSGGTPRPCTLPPDETSVAGHVVAPHTTYTFDASCSFGLSGATDAAAYTPAGKLVARWITNS